MRTSLNKEIFSNEAAWQEEWTNRVSVVLQRCTRCLYDETTPSITFDADGVCNYCHTHDQLCREYPSGDEGWKRIQVIADQIRKRGRKAPYDVVVGVSGGADSSFLVHLTKELGLRPLAVHFDNTWDSTIAVENIKRLLDILNVDLWTYVVNNEEYDRIYRSFLESGVPDLESPTDIGLARTLNMAAEKYGIKFIFEGHSFRTEGIAPLGWLYMDARYIQTIHSTYGDGKLETFPNLWFSSMMKSMLFHRTKKIRPLWYINHTKENTKKMLAEKYGWQWYGGHHLENRITAFYHTYFLPRRFNIDMRLLGFSALIRSGQMKREDGLSLISNPPLCDMDLLEMVKKRLDLSDDRFIQLMSLPVRTYREFRTYKQMFERLRPFFYLMAKSNLIPKSFYIKYTSRNSI